MRPLTLRPPVLLIGAVSDFSGVDFVISSNEETLMKRRPVEVGLYFLSAISQSILDGFACRKCAASSAFSYLRSREDLDLLARVDLHDRLLPALPRPLVQPAPLRLRLHLRDVDREHADLEQLLDGLADLRLVRLGVHAERVLLLLDQPIALLRDDRRDDHLAGREAHDDSSSAASAGAPLPSPAP